MKSTERDLSPFLDMDVQCCHIFESFITVGTRLVLIPELGQSVVDNETFLADISEKVFYKYGAKIDSSDGLILRDLSLIDDIRTTDKYLIFTALESTEQDVNDDYWDEDFNLKNLIFLGWSINSDSGDSAATDGVFPIIFNDLLADKERMLKIMDEDSLNEWGLISNKDTCLKYIKTNQTTVKHIIVYDDGTEEQLPTNWNAVGVYCDKCTYNKLKLKRKSLKPS